jgi:hypothetical protein
MCHGQLSGQQGNLAVGKRSFGTILHIAQQRVSDVRQLNADLMATAGLQPNLYETVLSYFIEYPIVQDRLLTSTCPLFDHPARPVVPFKIMLQSVRFFRHQTWYHRKVLFFDTPFPELLGEAARRFGRSGKQDHARNGPIQPVNKPQKDVSRLVESLFQPFFPKVQQTDITGSIPLHQ